MQTVQSTARRWLVGVVCAVGVQAAWASASAVDFSDLVEQNAKAVVNISASAKAVRSKPSLQQQQQIPDIFKKFFGDDFGMPQQRDRQSFGSGFIISKDGYVLTNNHVVVDADKVVIRLNDRRELEADVVGTDERTDVALLKIKADDLPTVKIGNPDKLKVGQPVLAIGSPFGFDYSATAGIVSAKSRALPNESYVPFIQTDVAINPGNSGGPLFNADGEVIGINSQIYSRSGGYMGLAFAIPIDVAMEVADQLKAGGKVSRGYLGVVVQDVDRDLAEAYGLAKPAGALVAKVIPETPAEKAGLKEGDVITAFDGHDIGLSSELPQMIGRAKVGKKTPLTVLRDGKPQTLTFEVASLPNDADDDGGSTSGEPDIDSLHISIRNLNDQEKAQLKVDGGVVVMQVVDGVAADAGVRPGDIILKLNGQAIKETKDFVAIARKLPVNKAVPMLTLRQGQPKILAIRLEGKETEKKKR
ncbi:serine protease Do [Fluviicoccus keumensis]|uniref:Probable periplasmic serine endoprotease DegP-like n=1 Tax=Fluviicoccus keumensis TaxID=1435465 RepID=A0A4Q7ZAI7_9GAMM|nr:DegQ family serine endoprotease [Fluviicoccus keumensis]RZU47101.1 serine protease Do [Fluviicoccus keumensis]